jgi:hypothetical protein
MEQFMLCSVVNRKTSLLYRAFKRVNCDIQKCRYGTVKRLHKFLEVLLCCSHTKCSHIGYYCIYGIKNYRAKLTSTAIRPLYRKSRESKTNFERFYEENTPITRMTLYTVNSFENYSENKLLPHYHRPMNVSIGQALEDFC